MTDKKSEKENQTRQGVAVISKGSNEKESLPETLSRPNSTSPRDKWKDLKARSTRDLKANQDLLLPNPTSPVKANGSVKPGLQRTDSLTVPGKVLANASPKRNPEDGKDSAEPHERTNTLESRRSSARSVDSKLSNSDFSRLQNAPVVQAKKEDEEKVNNTIQTDDVYIRSVIPYLPQGLAVICLLLNVFIPGTGTMLSGFCIFCCGEPRVQSKEDHKMITFCTNVMVGGMQLFTVPFMLVGWFWSLVWGVYMLILAAEHKKEEKQRREKELQAKALTALNANLRPWTLMRS